MIMRFMELTDADGRKITVNVANINMFGPITLNGQQCSFMDLNDNRTRLYLGEKYDDLKTALEVEKMKNS